MPEALKEWTIVLLRPEGHAPNYPFNIFFTTVKARDVGDAVVKAQKEACRAHREGQPGDYTPFISIPGKVALDPLF